MKQLNWYQIFGNVHTIPEGSTVTPTDDVQILLHCANIWDKSYTTIGEVIADDDTLFLTLIDNNAIDYLVRSTTFASSIVADEESMEYIGASDYASETLLSDLTWATAINGSPYSSYIINDTVPTMTSNTAPSGEAFGSSVWGNQAQYQYYKAFDGNDSSCWNASDQDSVNNSWIGYKYTTPGVVPYIRLKTVAWGAGTRIAGFKLQGSDNGNDWTDITSVSDRSDGDTYYAFENTSAYLYHRILITAVVGATAFSSGAITAHTVQFYGREIGGVQSWLKAGGITNKKYTTVSEVLSDLTTLAALMASSDAIDYLVTAKGWATEICSDSNAMADIGMNNYAANTLLADETWGTAICNSTYYESVINVKNPDMTSDTQPYGICSASSVYNGNQNPAWKAFDGTNVNYGDSWQSASEFAGNEWIGYEFTSAVMVKYLVMTNRVTSYIYSPRDFKLQGSNDGVTWTDLGSYTNTNNGSGAVGKYLTTNGTKYKKYRIYITSANGLPATNKTVNVGLLYFYGRKDI